jgi:hypothetical protein
MPPEANTEASQEEQTEEMDFSDAALSRAAEGAEEEETVEASTEEVEEVEEEVAEEEETEPVDTEKDPLQLEEEEETEALEAEVGEEEEVQPEPSDNADRSKLGRKVKFMEDSLNGIKESIDDRMDRIEQMLTKNQQPEPYKEDFEDEDDEEIILTKKEFKEQMQSFMTEQQTQKTDSQAQYEKGYLSTIKQLGAEEESEDEFNAIYDEMMTNFNNKLSDNPEMDAERNWLKATKSVLKKQAAQPIKKENPLKGRKPKAPLGKGSTDTVPKSASAVPELDDVAAEFIKKTGMSDELVADALNGEAPARLARR